jgi:hypothetical protein
MLQRHNITGSEVKTRDQNVPGYGAMRAAGLRRQSRGWLVPALLVLLILAVIALIGVVATRMGERPGLGAGALSIPRTSARS